MIKPVSLAALLVSLGGCNWLSPPVRPLPMPEPLDLTLPKQIHVHPLTSSRVFGEAGGVTGIDLRIEALDDWGDSTKAFGRFRFELYRHAGGADPKGPCQAVWNNEDLDLSSAKRNRAHWNKFQRTYDFRLGWQAPIPVGHRLVIVAYFESEFGSRLSDQRVLIAGQ